MNSLAQYAILLGLTVGAVGLVLSLYALSEHAGLRLLSKPS